MPALNIKPLTEVDFAKGSSATNPIPPPGQPYDGRISEDLSGLYPSTKQVTEITLATSVAVDDVHTLTITPTLMANGSPWGNDLGPISVSFTSVDTVIDSQAKGLVAAFAAAQTTGTLADLANFQRVSDIVQVTSPTTNDILLTSTQAGSTFEYTLVTDGSMTESAVTTGLADAPLQVGIVLVADGFQANGQPKLRAFASGDAVAAIVGICRDSNMVEPLTAGAPHRFYSRKRDVIFRSWGSVTALGGTAGVQGPTVWIRHTAGAGVNQVAGSIDPADGGSHTIWPAASYLRSTTVSGTQAILIAHP